MDGDSPVARPAAVLLGADSYVGLQTARILRSRGVSVTGIASDPKSACCRTRSLSRVIQASPEPASISVLEAVGESFDVKPVLIPCSDEWVLIASRHRQALMRYFLMVLPETDSVEQLMDKSRFYAFARAHQFPVVPFDTVRTREDAERSATTRQFPVVMKPAHRSRRWARCAGEKAVKVDTPEGLMSLYARCGDTVPALVVQEWIHGGDEDLIACNLYVDRSGEVLVTFVTKKIRQYPPLTGQGCLAVEARDDEALALTLAVFREAGLRGLGSLEMKRDVLDGRLYITEPNIGRPTGRSPITEAAGVAFVYAAYCDAAGLPLPPNRTQTYGDAKWIYLSRDIISAWHYFRTGELTLREWWHSLRGPKYFAIFSWSDPLPFLLDGPQSAMRGLRLARGAAKARKAQVRSSRSHRTR